MNTLRRTILLAGSVLTVTLASAAAQAGVPDDGPIPGHYIVTLKESVEPAAAAKALAVTHALTVGHVYRNALRGFSARIPDARLQQLRDDPRVENVVADHYMHIAAKPAPSQPAEVVPTGVSRINGPGGTVTGVKVAVIDTGINKHPDLPPLAGGKNCSTGRSYADGNGHGTHVAGTIGAIGNNGIGVVGVAPGVPLLAVRVLDNAGSGSWASVICGIDWVTAEANNDQSTRFVANMSLGGSSPLDTITAGGLHQAIYNSVIAGVTYAVAAGNSAIDAFTPNGSGYVQVPAAYDEVITVSALADFNGEPGGNGAPTCRTDEDDTFANFSNYGAGIDLIAPGVCIKSTWKGGGYNTISGTSMATPHVTGAAALYLAKNPDAKPDDVKTRLTRETPESLDWLHGTDDPDHIKEPLLDVSGL